MGMLLMKMPMRPEGGRRKVKGRHRWWPDQKRSGNGRRRHSNKELVQ